jgi:hypothetical protein
VNKKSPYSEHSISENYWFILSVLAEAGYNTSTVALQVIEGDEMGTRYLGV